jgi:hypothetical protein
MTTTDYDNAERRTLPVGAWLGGQSGLGGSAACHDISQRHRRNVAPVPPGARLLGAMFRLIAANVAIGRIEDPPDLIRDLADLMGVFEPIAA